MAGLEAFLATLSGVQRALEYRSVGALKSRCILCSVGALVRLALVRIIASSAQNDRTSGWESITANRDNIVPRIQLERRKICVDCCRSRIARLVAA